MMRRRCDLSHSSRRNGVVVVGQQTAHEFAHAGVGVCRRGAARVCREDYSPAHSQSASSAFDTETPGLAPMTNQTGVAEWEYGDYEAEVVRVVQRHPGWTVFGMVSERQSRPTSPRRADRVI